MSLWTCAHCGRDGETPEGAVMVWHRCLRQDDQLAPRRFTIDELIDISEGETPEERRQSMFRRMLGDLAAYS